MGVSWGTSSENPVGRYYSMNLTNLMVVVTAMNLKKTDVTGVLEDETKGMEVETFSCSRRSAFALCIGTTPSALPDLAS